MNKSVILESPRATAKRQQIMAAARQLFLSQGYGRTSTESIRQVAGVSKQTLYVYFPAKVELLSAVVMAELWAFDAPQAPAAPVSLSELRARLLGLTHTFTAQVMQPDALALLRLLIGEAVHLPELRGTLRRAFPARLLAGVEALLSAAHQARLIDAPNLNLSARMLIGPVISFVALDGLLSDQPISQGPPTPPSRETLAELVDLFLLTVKK
ncbi:TetR/AcrR family transcriptional regulator (plasmid) [Deinococcus psychrotolerans]|uniref:TetR/AcrR family transcriptional regulator n=1 Tax=Deinococcus psychrotolerans TaxID=2489213 RepID=A0A3G8YI44_9DEIO|nr:TetR/AcrR family transcriptional regulator [Deinococcus psychrotolerans]AZI44653.1 TetR/AcrR family transcriptional regulator [Deinococcus psychrotolerans]